MCHQILWYHVLCRHSTQTHTYCIPCLQSIQNGYDCLGYEFLEIPIAGLCKYCSSTEGSEGDGIEVEGEMGKGDMSPIAEDGAEEKCP